MHLLKIRDDGEFSLIEFAGDNIPHYAILSHTWEADHEEVTFKDLKKGKGKDKTGYNKILFCGKQAAKDGLQHFWVDTCCINKSSSTELSEAINSMFRWYQNAAKCYVYLSDVSISVGYSQRLQTMQESALRVSKWFTRGWTLQELLAPASVEFFSKEGKLLGDKESLKRQIYEITGIPLEALSGTPLSNFSIEARMQWAAERKTTRKEDKAYCLLGIFGVFMPPIYGEEEHAFTRLEQAINKRPTEKEGMDRPLKRRKIESHTQHVNQSLAPAAKKDLLDSLRFDQIDDRFINIKPRHAKTCKWLLDSTEYLDWLSANKLPEHHGFFWIKGKPGSGKSTLTKFAFMEIKKFLPNTTLLSFFFNARGTYLEKSTIGLYRSLLVQLLEKCSDDQQIPNIPSSAYRPVADADREMLKHLFEQTMRTMSQHDITVVIDALDECDEDEVREMIAFFEKLGEDAVLSGGAFHVLFSSRHYPHITVQRRVEMILEDQQGHSQDIEKYLSSELKAGRGKQAELIRQEIRDRSSGIFMWIVLVVQILNKASDHGQVHVLRKKLRELPDDLNELFRRILTRDCQNLEEMKLCLQWILYANRSLKPEELYFAILSGTECEGPFLWDADEISTETMDLFILSSSKGLAEITKSKAHTVQFIHESVRDFLMKENGLSQVWADLKVNTIGLSHNRLKECCFNYIRSNPSSHLDVTESLPSASSSEAVELRKKASLKFPFLEYAVRNILAHADLSQAEGVGQERFMQEFKLSKWVQLNNIVERYQVRRFPPDIDLLYILAERNCSNLIAILMRDGLFPRGQYGRHGNPIFAAIAAGSSQALEALVKRDIQMYPHGCRFPYPSKDICSFLVKYGKPALITRFLSIYDVDITSTLKWGGTILIWAAETGHELIVKLLLKKGADINAQGRYYGNALQAAAGQGHEAVMKLLLEKGADINAQGGYHGNALQAAAGQGQEAVVKLLLEKGADINAQGGYHGNALMAATVRGDEAVVKLLLEKGADINAQGNYGNALYMASFRGHEAVVKLLLEKGFDINAQSGYHGNALKAATVRGDEAVVKLLLEKGADINVQGGYHGNAL